MRKHKLAAAVLIIAAAAMPASAGVHLIAHQVGDDVVITGGGRLDITQLVFGATVGPESASLSDTGLLVGGDGLIDSYSAASANFTGPAQITSSISPFSADAASGDLIGFSTTGNVAVPAGASTTRDYRVTSATFLNTTIADMQFTSNAMHWSWDSTAGEREFFNLVVNDPGNPSNRTYQLIDVPLSNGYGVSGSIETNGATGDFDADNPPPIIDWEITITTPDGTDGVTDRILTPFNSVLDAAIANGQLTITPSHISFGVDINAALLFIAFPDGDDEEFRVGPPVSGDEGGQLAVFDWSEANIFGRYDDPVVQPFVFAVVPEPSSLALLAIAGPLLARCRRRRDCDRAANDPAQGDTP